MLAAPRLRLLAVNSRPQPRLNMSSRAKTRVNQISRHINSKPFLELNTPFATERSARFEDENGNRIRPKKVQEVRKEVRQVQTLAPEPPKTQPPQVQPSQPQPPRTEPPKNPEPPKKMSNQAAHPALLIPGPIEFDDAVLSSMSHYRYVLTNKLVLFYC
jgi:alanine-glyoxylate transaminase/serine-glyoxylate transaminase/serine-pyruvate transaminase